MLNIYHFVGPAPQLWHPGDYFVSLGTPWGPWEQQEGHVGVRKQIFSGLGMILGPHIDSFLGSDALDSMFLFRLVPRSLFAVTFEWIS